MTKRKNQAPDSGYASMEEMDNVDETPEPRRSQRIKNKSDTKPKEPVKTIQKPKQKAKSKVVVKADKPKRPNAENVKLFLENEKDNQKNYITKDILDFLLNLYFDEKTIFGLGRDRIYYYIRATYPDKKISQTQINRFLQSLEVVQLFNPSKGQKDIAKTITSDIFKRGEIDLVDMSNMASKGFNWIFNYIDTFSKYVVSIPLKTKDEKTVLDGFKKVISQLEDKFNDIPSSILSDNGSEFINQPFRDYTKSKDIKQIFTKAQSKSSHAKLVENFNGYMRKQITKYDNQFDDTQWTEYLQTLINNYNNTRSRITKKTPIEIMNGNTDDVKDNIEKAVLPKNDKRQINPYKKGDFVRLKQEMGHKFEKPTNNIVWSKEVYTVDKVFLPKNNTVLLPKYKLKTSDDKEIKEFFYQNELYKVNPDTIKKITQPPKEIVQKILDKKVEDGKTLLKIKWKGGRNNITWESLHVMEVDVPKLVKNFLEKNKD